LFLKT
jgi:EF-hand domain